MRTRIYIALALTMGIMAIGSLWFGINRVADSSDVDSAVAVDDDFQPADIETTSPSPNDEVEKTARTNTDQARETETVATEESTVEPVRPGQSNSKRKKKGPEWKSAVLQIVTNFEKADVTVNGLPYPEYTPEGEEEGMVLPAGGPHIVEVVYDGKTKTYQVHLRAYETRILMVELSGLKGSTGGKQTAKRPASKKPDDKPSREEDKEEGIGRVTVYSKPNGTILIDGSQTEEKTPGTVEVDPGRHEIQVKFDNGDVSEKKIIRVRKGSRIKLFFRQRD